jgi:hypothetical protein
MTRSPLALASALLWGCGSPEGDDAGAVASAPCVILPADSWWNTEIVDAPVDPLSAPYVESLSGPSGRALHSAFTSDGKGFPYAVVDARVAKSSVAFDYARISDEGPYPIPPDPPIQQDLAGDRHMILLHTDECRLYELFQARETALGWAAGSGAVWDLRANEVRPPGRGSADAAGLPIFPGLVRYEEVESGEIRHALRFSAPGTQYGYVFPASHAASDGRADDPRLPPMGARVRLKASFDVGRFSPRVRTILVALQRYGMFVADNGPTNARHVFLDGVPDPRWDDAEMQVLRDVPATALEVIETGPITPGD